MHRDEFLQNVKLQLFAHVAKQAAFHQLRTVEQLGYITVLAQRLEHFLTLLIWNIYCVINLSSNAAITVVYVEFNLSFNPLSR